MNQLNRKYPIGEFVYRPEEVMREKKHYIEFFKNFPTELEAYLLNVPQLQMENSYREGSWSIRQLVHHLADSHLNMLLRVKFALTENHPTIKGYDEAAWAKLPDYELPVEMVLPLLQSIHLKAAYLFLHLSPEQWQQTYFHEGYQRSYTLEEVLGLYVWHAKHHFAHIRLAHEDPWKIS